MTEQEERDLKAQLADAKHQAHNNWQKNQKWQLIAWIVGIALVVWLFGRWRTDQ
jgi:hypothetical protein